MRDTLKMEVSDLDMKLTFDILDRDKDGKISFMDLKESQIFPIEKEKKQVFYDPEDRMNLLKHRRHKCRSKDCNNLRLNENGGK